MLNRKTIIVFIAALTIATIGILYITEKWIFDNSIKLYAFADDPTGISTTSTIQINGYQIGKVTSLEIIYNKVLFELSIKK